MSEEILKDAFRDYREYRNMFLILRRDVEGMSVGCSTSDFKNQILELMTELEVECIVGES